MVWYVLNSCTCFSAQVDKLSISFLTPDLPCWTLPCVAASLTWKSTVLVNPGSFYPLRWSPLVRFTTLHRPHALPQSSGTSLSPISLSPSSLQLARKSTCSTSSTNQNTSYAFRCSSFLDVVLCDHEAVLAFSRSTRPPEARVWVLVTRRPRQR